MNVAVHIGVPEFKMATAGRRCEFHSLESHRTLRTSATHDFVRQQAGLESVPAKAPTKWNPRGIILLGDVVSCDQIRPVSV